MKQVIYADADKYVLVKPYWDVAPFKPVALIQTNYGLFTPSGRFRINELFLFSASFPAVNTPETQRASAVHDFFYKLMKDGHLPRSFRYEVDYMFYNHLLEDGMNSLRAYGWFIAVRLGGDNALDTPEPKWKYSPKNNKDTPQISNPGDYLA